MSKSTLTNKDLAELLDHYLLTQKQELPEKFDKFIIPEGREGLMKLIKQRLKTTKDVSPPVAAISEARQRMQLKTGWAELKEVAMPGVNFERGKYATFEISKFFEDMKELDPVFRRDILLDAIWIILHTELDLKRVWWPEGVAKDEIIYTEMVNQITQDVIEHLSHATRSVLVIGLPENISLFDRLVDRDAVTTAQKAAIELHGGYSGWTIQTVPEARFHE